MDKIKKRRMEKFLNSYPDLRVSDCVPFYFCPRSVMLHKIHSSNSSNDPELSYHGGQDHILHLEADLCQVVKHADANKVRWVFTSSNAASDTFEDYTNIYQLDKLDWDAIEARDWQGRRRVKQAEFLVEGKFPWHLVSRVGVKSSKIYDYVTGIIQTLENPPLVKIMRDWYYPNKEGVPK